MQPLIPDMCYHIYNHANGFENVFQGDWNYHFFLEKYRLYIAPIAETYAYCLMPNHFHLVVRMRKRDFIEGLLKDNFSKVSNFGKVISNEEIEKYLSKQFANLFSCYTQSYNKVHNRMGSLFMKNFKREQITDKQKFFNDIMYTHRNPVHHGFCMSYHEWDYSSYNEIVGGNSLTIETSKLISMFGGKDNFVEQHRVYLDEYKSRLITK